MESLRFLLLADIFVFAAVWLHAAQGRRGSFLLGAAAKRASEPRWTSDAARRRPVDAIPARRALFVGASVLQDASPRGIGVDTRGVPGSPVVAPGRVGGTATTPRFAKMRISNY